MFPFSAEGAVIQTSSGIVKGVLVNNVVTWHDIPYAQPPIGNLRWHAPRILSTRA